MDPPSLRIDLSDFPTPKGAGRTGKKRDGRDPGPKGILFRCVRWSALLLVLGALPFFTLLRVSVFLLQEYGMDSWLALVGGASATLLLLSSYLVAVSLRMGRKGRVPGAMVKGAGVLVAAYCLLSLLYLSAGNAKTEEIRSTYTRLNPLLRVGVSTLLFLDGNVLLTSTGRDLDEYSAWGLSTNPTSLHLPQEDGYVYAVDLRTRGRPEWRNRAVSVYFRAMGFETLRHLGTADHLHVHLLPRAEPNDPRGVRPR